MNCFSVFIQKSAVHVSAWVLILYIETDEKTHNDKHIYIVAFEYKDILV